MNYYSWELFRYSDPLKEPLRMLGQVLNEREGLILRLSETPFRVLQQKYLEKEKLLLSPGYIPNLSHRQKVKSRNIFAVIPSQNIVQSSFLDLFVLDWIWLSEL